MGKGVKWYIRQTLPEDLAEFLLKKRIMKKYIERVYQDQIREGLALKGRAPHNVDIKFVSQLAASRAKRIQTAFIWQKTPEGYAYWSKIHEDFIGFKYAMK